MTKYTVSDYRRHHKTNLLMVCETILIFILVSTIATVLHQYISGPIYWLCYIPLVFFQGFWLDRIYVVGHEATHKKLFPKNPLFNDIIGSVILLPLLVPVRIYRKIHYFHHGFNRKDHDTSALDVYVSEKPLSPIRKVWYKFLWYAGVFAGGYFFHSLVSIIIFLFIPTKVAVKISPAFKNWSVKDRVVSWLQFLAGVAFHAAFWLIGGFDVWLYSLGFPILAFAWIWSMLVYIFHYDTTIGDHVRYNTRSLKRHWFFSWLLLNFNEHASHHMYPHIPWYELPEKSQPLPEPYAANQNVQTIYQAIWQQLKGPKIVYRHDLTHIDF
jgi:fatty acid desaturase